MAYKIHPLAAKYPRMTGKDFNLLVADIRKHGVREPRVLLDGMTLDGPNRDALITALLQRASARQAPCAGRTSKTVGFHTKRSD
jgi:hypothetical protein